MLEKSALKLFTVANFDVDSVDTIKVPCCYIWLLVIVSCHSTLLEKISAELIASKQYPFYSWLNHLQQKQDLKIQTLECCSWVCRGWSSHVSERSSSFTGCLRFDVGVSVLNKTEKWYHN